ncbi:hypothetical protein EYF80_060382 [Liparis tanakae]|uniref:Uncharacterized protein n=1 Tax=Liparis tanakae TaxID=230148 RepID=A0A4Z2EKY2_9TELE|nr:hypothetical protein EYF80_060382 [Liparis tanakae]
MTVPVAAFKEGQGAGFSPHPRGGCSEQCIPEACPFWLAQWGARWRLRSLKSSPRSCVRSDPSLQGGVVGQGPAFVQRRILWPIVRRPQPFRDFKGSFAQFLLSAALSTEKQESSVGG